MSEHTKLPWRVEKDTGLVWGDCTVLEDGTPDRLGIPVTDGQLERPWAKGNGPTYAEMEANAAFIVKAVNNHDLLVAALQEADKALEALGVESIHRVRWNVIRFALSRSGVDVGSLQPPEGK